MKKTFALIIVIFIVFLCTGSISAQSDEGNSSAGGDVYYSTGAPSGSEPGYFEEPAEGFAFIDELIDLPPLEEDQFDAPGFDNKFFDSHVEIDRKPGEERLMEKLKLSDEQKNKIETLRTTHQKKMIDMKADLQKAMIDLRALRQSDNIVRANVISSVEKINKVKNDIALAAANHRMDIYDILTPDQRKTMKEFRENHPRTQMFKYRREGMRDRLKEHVE